MYDGDMLNNVDERCAHIIPRRLQLQHSEVLVTHIHPAYREAPFIGLDGNTILLSDLGNGYRQVVQDPAPISKWSATFKGGAADMYALHGLTC